MRQKRLLLNYPVYPIFPSCAVKTGQTAGIARTVAIGRPLLNTTLFSLKGKSLSHFEQAVEQPYCSLLFNSHTDS